MAIDGVPWLHWLPHPRISEEKGVYERRWWALIAVSISVFLIATDIAIFGRSD